MVWQFAGWISCRGHNGKCPGSGARGIGFQLSCESWLLVVFWLCNLRKANHSCEPWFAGKCNNVIHASPTSWIVVSFKEGLGKDSVSQCMKWLLLTRLGTEDIGLHKTDTYPCPLEASILAGRQLHTYQGCLDSLKLNLDVIQKSNHGADTIVSYLSHYGLWTLVSKRWISHEKRKLVLLCSLLLKETRSLIPYHWIQSSLKCSECCGPCYPPHRLLCPSNLIHSLVLCPMCVEIATLHVFASSGPLCPPSLSPLWEPGCHVQLSHLSPGPTLVSSEALWVTR